MRRLGAVVAAALLTLVLGSSAVGAPSRSSFNGDFDVLVGGSLMGHITAQVADPADGGYAGDWAFTDTSGAVNRGVIGAPFFYAREGYNELWWKALELAPTPNYGIFVAHVVDYLDPEATDTIEFWSAPIDWDPGRVGTIGEVWNGTMDVGAGAFVLKVR